MANYDDWLLRAAEEEMERQDEEIEREKGKKALAALDLQMDLLELFEKKEGNASFVIEKVDGKFKISFDTSEAVGEGATLTEMFESLRDYLIEQEEEKEDISFEELLKQTKNHKYRI